MHIYLYVKQCSHCGLRYFGKTTVNDPYKYKGGGKIWNKHTKKYGKNNIETIQLWKFESQLEATEFALKFSTDNNIVESKSWANLQPENGIDGTAPGAKFVNRKCISAEDREKLAAAKRGKKISEKHRQILLNQDRSFMQTPEYRNKVSQAKKGKPFSEEHKKALSEAQKKRYADLKAR